MNVRDAFLPGLPLALIEKAFRAAPGKELESGKLLSPESSAALAANAFGLFLDQADTLPPVPGTEDFGWPAQRVCLERVLRFPWRGGRHPCLDVLVETTAALIGVESKRYEPYRQTKDAGFSETYWRPVWGDAMRGYLRIRDDLHSGKVRLRHLDAVQLVKHAFGLRSAVQSDRYSGKLPVLVYLYAEPRRWPDGREVPEGDIERHRDEISSFAAAISGDEVAFRTLSYRSLIEVWLKSDRPQVARHAAALSARFDV